ncbi:MAG: monovalent cation/H+ antiporter complex subunit F [Anaerolineales bacterium]|jgi:multicomponent Na+:H+ antiporter subunit F|nr:monovalent cation/H+ antiporter complex subunit F [Anaerolineales bacterium]
MTFLNTLSFGLLAAAFILVVIKMFLEPSRDHRILALGRAISLDLMATLAIGFITLFAVVNDKKLFLDVAMVLALIAFLGTVAFARYLEKGK